MIGQSPIGAAPIGSEGFGADPADVCETQISATTQNAVGSIQSISGDFCITQVNAITGNAVGNIVSKSGASFLGWQKETSITSTWTKENGL